jgi:hypothetical protein
VASDLYESGILTAGARILRADNGSEVAVSDLAGTTERPLVWSLDEPMRLVARPNAARGPERTAGSVHAAVGLRP